MHISSIPINFIYILGHIFSGRLRERCFGENFVWRICWTGFGLNACFLLLSCIRVASHSWGSNTSNFSITEVQLEKCMCKNQFRSVAQSCPTLCDPMDCSTPGSLVLHELPELAQTHVHQVGDFIQPSHPLLSSSPAFNLSQHRGLFQWVCSSCQLDKVLEFRPQHQSFQWIFRTDFLYDGLLWPPCSPRDSQ